MINFGYFSVFSKAKAFEMSPIATPVSWKPQKKSGSIS